MLLQKLRLENFQGIKELEIEPQGHSFSVYGDNATGKTTLFNSITWLLFDRSSTGAKGFTPQPRDKDGEIHHLESSVDAVFSTSDADVSLKKVYKEVWKKKRGSAKETFSGHATDYYINGVPRKESEYSEMVNLMCGNIAELPQILSMPDYFPETMKWQDRRKYLIELCGDVSDEEVIKSEKGLKELPSFLKMPESDELYSIDEYRDILAAERKKINKRLDEIPARIDEASKSIEDVGDLDAEEIDRKIEANEKKLDELREKRDKKLFSAENENFITLQQKQAEYEQAKAEYLKKKNEENAEITKETNLVNEEIRKLQEQEYFSTADLNKIKNRVAEMKNRRTLLLIEWNKVSDEKWDSNSEICPTCGQRLSPDAIAKSRENFNLNKSKRLEELNKKGQESCSKEMIEDAESQIAQAEKGIEAIRANISIAEKKKNELPEPAASKAFEDTADGKKLLTEIEELEKKNKSDASDLADVELTEKLNREVIVLHAEKAKLNQADRQKERIGQLEAEQRKLSEEYDRTEKGLFLTDLFIRTKVSMLDDKINSHFKSVKFQLFTEQVNGGLKEVCEVLVPGADGRMIPYAYANNAARINAGLEIIEAFSRHKGIKMPVVLDNCESVTNPLKIDTQEIKLYVSEKDKKLRVVIEEQED